MTTPNEPIQIIAPLTPAWERMKVLLFRPFNLEKWLAIGFCAWLAFLGQMGGGGGGGGGSNYADGNQVRNLQEAFDHARDWVMRNLNWLLPLVVGLAVLGLAIWLLLMWLSSRGRFMFLHCVARDRAEIRVPWTHYAAPAQSLFFFRLILAVGMFFIVVPILGGVGWLVAIMVAHHNPDPVFITGAAGLALVGGCLGLGFVIVTKLTSDFVVPLMYLQMSTCTAAWRALWSLIAAQPAAFLLYLLFQIVIKIAVGLAVLALVLVTCCVAGCLLALPYVGTVVMLPVLVFERSYSLYFLAQFGPPYDVFTAGEPAAEA